jgi:hypothetical protein
MRKNVRGFIRRLEAAGLTVLRDGKPLRVPSVGRQKPRVLFPHPSAESWFSTFAAERTWAITAFTSVLSWR